jgi:excisionase family DNA binding protein
VSEIAERRPDSSQESPGLQTVQTVAKFLSLSRSKVYQLMERGELPYVQIGKSRRLRWSDVMQLVDERRVAR